MCEGPRTPSTDSAIIHRSLIVKRQENGIELVTRPGMYQVIKKHGNLLNNYSKQLQAEGVVTQQEVDDVIQRYEKICEDAFKKAQEEKQVYHKHWLDSPWSGFFEGKDPLKCDPTGLREETLVHIGKRFGAGPPNAEDFKIHRGLQRVLAARSQV